MGSSFLGWSGGCIYLYIGTDLRRARSEAREEPKNSHVDPNSAPNGAQERPRDTQECPSGAQERPSRAPSLPKASQSLPKPSQSLPNPSQSLPKAFPKPHFGPLGTALGSLGDPKSSFGLPKMMSWDFTKFYRILRNFTKFMIFSNVAQRPIFDLWVDFSDPFRRYLNQGEWKPGNFQKMYMFF